MPREAKSQFTRKQEDQVRPIAPPRGAATDDLEPVAANDEGGDKRPESSPSEPIAEKMASQRSEAELGEYGSRPTASEPIQPAEDGRGGMDDKDQRTREIAYFLWQEEGFPDGRSTEHWAAARAVVDAQDAERANGEEDETDKPRAT